jgi:hypothetical protein
VSPAHTSVFNLNDSFAPVQSGLTIAKYPGDSKPAIIDGTVEVTAEWEQTKHNGQDVWATTETTAVWQLFYVDGGGNRVHLPPARYPDASPWTREGYDRDGGHWRYESTSSSFGFMSELEPQAHALLSLAQHRTPSTPQPIPINTHPTSNHHPPTTVDSGPEAEEETDDEFGSMTTDGATDYAAGSVAELGVSLKGCPLVLNIGHWTTMQSYVSNHTTGQRNFTYNSKNCGGRDCPAEGFPGDGKGRYFVERELPRSA